MAKEPTKQALIAPEVAEQDFERIADFFDVDVDTNSMTEEDAESFTPIKDKIVKAICAGRLTVSEQGAPTYTTKDDKRLTFSAPNGATLMAARDKDDNMRKMFSVIRELTGGGVPPSHLSPRDTGVLIALVSLFMSELA